MNKNDNLQSPVKNTVLYIVLNALAGIITGIVILYVCSIPAINFKYVFRYMPWSLLTTAAISGTLGALFGFAQLYLLKRAKI